MQKTFIPSLQADIHQQVKTALEEDIGCGDITAQLIPEQQCAHATVITREPCTLAGSAWVEAVFKQLDQRYHTQTQIDWQARDGQQVSANSTLFHVSGNARVLLSGERSALNFLQLLSGTATQCQSYANQVKHTSVKLLDTRKTIPGLRTAQKYAVTQGGCFNHRMGLFDAFLIKENHIAACGGIQQAISVARALHKDKAVEIEVENVEELALALDAQADIVMLDNFSLANLKAGVQLNHKHRHPAKLEASGNINPTSLVAIAETGVDYISIGALTKHCRAVDLSMRLTPVSD